MLSYVHELVSIIAVYLFIYFLDFNILRKIAANDRINTTSDHLNGWFERRALTET